MASSRGKYLAGGGALSLENSCCVRDERMDLCWDELGHLESAFFLCGATVAFDAVRYWSRKYRQINFCLHTHTHTLLLLVVHLNEEDSP